MERCPHRPLALRALVAVAVVLVATQFALQRDERGLLPGFTQPSATGHFVSDAFPTAEAGVLAAR